MKAANLIKTSVLLTCFALSLSANASDISSSCQQIVNTKILQAGFQPAGAIDMFALDGENTIEAEFGMIQLTGLNFMSVSIESSVCSSQPTGKERVSLIEVDQASDLKGAFRQ